jgi:cytochrome c peroxidase
MRKKSATPRDSAAGSAGPGAGVVLGVLCAAMSAGACDKGLFSPDEMSTLKTLAISGASLMPDTSNVFADSIPAAQLGKKLFFDVRLGGPLGPYNDGATNGSLGASGDTGKIACASCHQLDQGGTDHRSQPPNVSLGASYTGRNALAVINAGFSPRWQFWDGRKDSLWSQALAPTESPVEANGSRLQTAHVIFDNYRPDYEALFDVMPDLSDTVRFPPTGKPGDDSFDMMAPDDQNAVNLIFANFGKSVAAYERQLTSPSFQPSAFDQFMAGDDNALSPSAIAGARLFIGKAGCLECHRGALFTDFGFHNIGAPQEGDHVPYTDQGRYDGIMQVSADPFNRAGAYSDDKGSAVIPDPNNVPAETLGEFMTPTLRNVAKTAPYMHDGAYQTLWDVVNHYNFGGGTGRYSGTKSPLIAPLLLTSDEVDDLVAFLQSLSDGDPKDTDSFPEGLITPPM